jgi:hypothetical protein
MAYPYIGEDQRRDLVCARVTINGKPAVIGGIKCQFAMVRSLDGSVSAEYAWSTVARIVARDGKFTA